MDNKILKQALSIAAFIAALCLSFWGCWLIPTGEISGSVLIMCAQLFCLAAGFLGIKIDIDLGRKKVYASDEPEKDRE